MADVLVISYTFPPMGGAGVQRTLKFVKYLPEYGWNSHVLSAQPLKSGLRDEGLLKDVPQGTPVIYTKALRLFHRIPWRIRDLITRWLLTVDEQVGWYPFAISAGMQIIQQSPVKMIYSTAPPYTNHLVAHYLHQKTNLPWVADFRDPWIGNFSLRYPTVIHRKINEKLETKIIKEANHLLVTSQPISQSFLERIPGIQPSKISWIPNGYDNEDFTNAQPVIRLKECFYLAYTGSFYAHGITAWSILQATHNVIIRGQIPRDRLRLQLVGNIGKSTREWITQLKLEDIVETPGYVSHEQSIGYLLSADVLLLIIGASTGSSAIYTAKIFEYLACGKPILCLAGTGVASDLISKAGAGIIISPEDVEQIGFRMADMYHQWNNGSLAIHPDQALIQTFDRRRQTGELAKIFDRLLITKV